MDITNEIARPPGYEFDPSGSTSPASQAKPFGTHSPADLQYLLTLMRSREIDGRPRRYVA